MIEQQDYRHIWLIMSAMAGTITALAQMKYREMTWADIGFTLFSGFGFAVFFMPWIATAWFSISPDDTRATNAVVYIGGTGWNILMPFAIARVRHFLGGKDAL